MKACTYEKLVKKPEFGEHERVYLQFHGVNASAKVMLNGNHVCSHHGGYSTFRTDVTDLLQEVNGKRREAIADGMSLEEAMKTYQ